MGRRPVPRGATPPVPQDPNALELRKEKTETSLVLMREYHKQIKKRIEEGALDDASLDKLASEYRKLLLALKEPTSQNLALFVAPSTPQERNVTPDQGRRDKAVEMAGETGSEILGSQEDFLRNEGE